MQRVVGNRPGLGAWGVLHKRCGDYPGLLVGIPSLLLDQPATESGPVEGFFILRTQRFGAEGLPLGLVVRVWFRVADVPVFVAGERCMLAASGVVGDGNDDGGLSDLTSSCDKGADPGVLQPDAGTNVPLDAGVFPGVPLLHHLEQVVLLPVHRWFGPRKCVRASMFGLASSPGDESGSMGAIPSEVLMFGLPGCLNCLMKDRASGVRGRRTSNV
jgi:hypothetical protein